MLISLSIRDIVLIEQLELEWRPQLCTLTGETGAGKSILLDSLGLAIGARGDAGLVRQGCQQGSVTAVFTLTPEHPVQDILRAHDLAGAQETADELILRRVQSSDGRSRAYCNDQAIGVGLLAEIGAQLVEIHGQNESQALTDAATQRRLLDRFGKLEGQANSVAADYATMQAAQKQLDAYREAIEKARNDTDYLTYALKELRDLAPQADEETSLSDERILLMNAEKIASDLREAEQFLRGERGVETALNSALKRLERAAPQAAGLLDEAVSSIDRTLIEAREASEVLAVAMSRITHDPVRLEKVDGRLFALRDIARKHKVSCDQLPALEEKFAQQLADIDGGTKRLAALESEAQAARAAYQKAAQDLSAARRKIAADLDVLVNQELAPLKLDGGQFTTQITSAEPEDGGPHGLDRISFEASTNPGMAPGAIAKIASGGELARFMLALKVSLAAQGEPCTLIFDEVDAGVGGAVAEAVGGRLQRLAQNGQVLVVTHSPQVAARGDSHWQVRKSDAGQGMSTQVTLLQDDSRLEEVARMLAGAAVTDEARAAARRLLEAS
jgi:DNA repair protein RecN (Recombination protein N)